MTPLLAFVLGGAAMVALMALRARRFGFAGQAPAEYAATTPAIDIRTHLGGPILCEGVIYGPTGRVVSRFVADMEGAWQGETGTLSEHFRYDSGSEQHRAWRFTLGSGGRIIGEADDLVGRAEGRISGSTICLNYRIRLTKEAGGHVLDVTDWMYLLENGTIINRSQMRKFGLTVAELVATMRPAEPAA